MKLHKDLIDLIARDYLPSYTLQPWIEIKKYKEQIEKYGRILPQLLALDAQFLERLPKREHLYYLCFNGQTSKLIDYCNSQPYIWRTTSYYISCVDSVLDNFNNYIGPLFINPNNVLKSILSYASLYSHKNNLVFKPCRNIELIHILLKII